MNTQLFTLALLEIVLSIIITVIVVYISYKILQRLFFSQQGLQGNNMAFTIFTSGIIISIGMILSEILPSITNIVRIATTQDTNINNWTIAQYSGLYLLIGFVMSVLINLAVFFLYSVLTKGIHEFKEIQKNNISVAIIVVSLLLSITLIVKNSIALLISALIPYPEISNFL